MVAVRTAFRSLRSLSAAAVLVGTTALAATPAFAAAELLTNGNFEQFTVGGVAGTSSYQVNSPHTSTGATLTGWNNSAYTFLFTPGTAATTGAVNTEYNSTFALWGPQGGVNSPNYSNNGLTATSPTGGNFLAADGAYEQGYISQTVNGLSSGATYSLSFYWAAAQQSGYTGDTTEGFNVYWADSSLNVVTAVSTPTVNTVSKGFTNWTKQTYQFVATTTTMTIGFLATGGPGGVPPFSLLDGVSLTAAPEPATWAILIAGLVGITFLRKRRRAGGSSAA